MKIELEFAELHTPLFFLGKNFGMKLDDGKHRGISLFYDKERDWLVVVWDGRETWVPLSNVSNMTPRKLEGAKKEAVKAEPAAAPKVPFTAQVSTPTDHVFAGPGQGKSR